MGKSSRVQHEGIVKSISTQTLEVSIISHSACSGCHAKSACGIADMKEKVITAQRPREELRPGDKVIVYASVNNAFYSVLLAYIMPSILIIATIFFLEKPEVVNYTQRSAASSYWPDILLSCISAGIKLPGKLILPLKK